MVTGHTSHQVGLDVDIWLTPTPDRILTPQEREDMTAVSMLKDPFTVEPAKWTPLHTKLIKRAASYPEVDRIFVHPAIKKVLCEQAGNDRAWLAKSRLWWNHYYHFHVRVKCPSGATDCEGQKPLSGDDGCGQELTNRYEKLKRVGIRRNHAAAVGGEQATQVSYHGEASARMQHSAYRRRRRARAFQCRHHAAAGLKGSRQQRIGAAPA